MRKNRLTAALLAAPALAAMFVLPGCMSTSGPKLTEGMVKQHLHKWCTKQVDVLETFGPPDQVTHKDDVQIWVYERIVTERETTGAYATVVLAGVGGKTERSASVSTMLIMYFDVCDTLIDYRLHKAAF